jgi:hypothetical protein
MVMFRTVGGADGLAALASWSEHVPEAPSLAHPPLADGPFAASAEWRSLRGRVGQVVATAGATGSSAVVAIFACPRRSRIGQVSTPSFAAGAFRSALRAWRVGEDRIVVLGGDMVGAVLPDWHPDALANLVEAMSVRPGMPAFIWGASLCPTDGEDADDLLGVAVARLGLAQAADAPDFAAPIDSGRAGRAVFALLATAALGAGILVPVTMSSGPPAPVLPSASSRHLAAGASPFGGASSANGSSPARASAAPGSSSTAPSAPAQRPGSLLAGVGGSAPGVVPSPSGANVPAPSSSTPNPAGSPGPGPGSGPLSGGTGLNGVSAASTPTTTPLPTPTTTTAPPTTTTTTIAPTPTTTTTAPPHSGGGCFLIFCG